MSTPAAPKETEQEHRDKEREHREKEEAQWAQKQRDDEVKGTQQQSRPKAGQRSAENQSTVPSESTQETRTQLVTLYCRGSDSDAKALYGAYPGANDGGWQALERMLAPVKAFILNGDGPYVNPYAVTTEYAGVPVPEPEARGAQEPGRQNVTAQDAQEYRKGQDGQGPVTGSAEDAGSAEGKSSKGSLSADVEAEKLDRGEGSKDANPGARPGGGKSVEEHLAREKAAEDKSKQ